MIALARDCILLRQPGGGAVPAHGPALAVEVVTEGDSPFDEEFVMEASAAVLHYFKEIEGRDSVTVGEFAQCLEKVLQGFQPAASAPEPSAGCRVVEHDLAALAAGDEMAELFFFPRLRDALRSGLQTGPRLLRFRGLRACVKRLAGARRWTPRCEALRGQIVAYLRECLRAEAGEPCRLVIE